MEAFGVFYLLSNFAVAEGVLGFLAIVVAVCIVGIVACLLFILFMEKVVDPIHARIYETRSEKARRLATKREARERRKERIKHPFGY